MTVDFSMKSRYVNNRRSSLDENNVFEIACRTEVYSLLSSGAKRHSRYFYELNRT